MGHDFLFSIAYFGRNHLEVQIFLKHLTHFVKQCLKDTIDEQSLELRDFSIVFGEMVDSKLRSIVS